MWTSFPLPERVSGPVLEVQVTPFVAHEQIAGQERRVSLLEHVPHDFLLRFLVVDVAQELSGRVGLDDLADDHARFA